MKRKLGSAFSTLFVLVILVLFVMHPDITSRGAKNGLIISANMIVPSLLPFFILSSLISSLSIPGLLGRAAEPFMRKVFSVPGCACTPFILGILGGYPIGAAAVADLVEQNEISVKEAERLLPFCNNTGPAFIISAVGCGVFGSSVYGIGLYLCHIAAATALGIVFSGCSTSSRVPKPVYESKSLAAVLPGSIRSSVSNCVNICGYIVFFSVIMEFLESLGIMTAVCTFLSSSIGANVSFIRCFVAGFLELGNGVAAMKGLPPTPHALALAAFILGFGSLSVHCQTIAVCEKTKIKCARHFAGRILHGIISAALIFVFSVLFRI